MEKLCLLKLRYIDTPYLATITQHFIGRIVSLQVVGEISRDAVEKICKALKCEPGKEIRIDYRQVPLIPFEELSKEDAEKIKKQIMDMDTETILIIDVCRE